MIVEIVILKYKGKNLKEGNTFLQGYVVINGYKVIYHRSYPWAQALTNDGATTYGALLQKKPDN